MSHLRQQFIFLGKVTALFVCLTLLASFFLPSHLSLKRVHVYIHTHSHSHSHTHTHTHTYIHTHTHTYTHSHTLTHTHTHTHSHTLTHTHSHSHTHSHTLTHSHTHSHSHTLTHTHSHSHTHTHSLTHTHTHSHTLTHTHTYIHTYSLVGSDFAGAAVLITMGAVLGRASPFQLIIIAFFELMFYSANEALNVHVFMAADIGGSMLIHTFGAYFGLAVSLMLWNKKAEDHKNNSSAYHSDLFAMIGTLFLWLFWPSFNGALAAGNAQYRAVINTYFAMTAGVLSTFIFSILFDAKRKITMVSLYMYLAFVNCAVVTLLCCGGSRRDSENSETYMYLYTAILTSNCLSLLPSPSPPLPSLPSPLLPSPSPSLPPLTGPRAECHSGWGCGSGGYG